MYNKLKSILPILLIVVTLFGCTFYKKDVDSIGYVSNETPPFSLDPTTEGAPNTGSPNNEANPVNTTKIDWQIEFRDDPGVTRDDRVTYLPDDTLVFTVTFNQVMDRDSVENAFQQNILDPSMVYPMVTYPLLYFKWINPLQVEVTVEGKDQANLPGHYTLSPNGAFNKEKTLVLNDEMNLSFKLVSNKSLHSIDSSGQLSKPLGQIPYALAPVSQSFDSNQLILARTYASDIKGGLSAYLYDINSKKITNYFPDLNTLPFWGNDRILHMIKETSVIQFNNNEEQWIEFGDFPYIYGWSISPDLQYEVYILSKEQVTVNTRVSIMVKDLLNDTETIYENILSINALTQATHGYDTIAMIWANNQHQLYLRPTEGSSEQTANAYLFNLETGKITFAPAYLQTESAQSKPSWSSDGHYVAVSNTAEKAGIYDQEGNLIREWVTYMPKRSFYWHPTKLIVAYEAATDTGDYVIQFDLESGELIITEGEYTILGWNQEGTSLHVYQ